MIAALAMFLYVASGIAAPVIDWDPFWRPGNVKVIDCSDYRCEEL